MNVVEEGEMNGAESGRRFYKPDQRPAVVVGMSGDCRCGRWQQWGLLVPVCNTSHL
jgi:hypothetical protein